MPSPQTPLPSGTSLFPESACHPSKMCTDSFKKKGTGRLPNCYFSLLLGGGLSVLMASTHEVAQVRNLGVIRAPELVKLPQTSSAPVPSHLCPLLLSRCSTLVLITSYPNHPNMRSRRLTPSSLALLTVILRNQNNLPKAHS